MDETEGRLAVELARQSVESEISGREFEAKDVSESLHVERGVFVTLKTYPQDELRGCIGFPEPIYPLVEAVEAAARYACHDPRFPDLQESEADSITIEVSILSVPKLLSVNAEQRPQNINIGEDGLIIESGRHKGLLLPQVATEWNWDAETFLEQACRKADISASSWKHESVLVYKFQAEIFSEDSPRGRIGRR